MRWSSAVASANPRTVVVLQTGGAVFMPWIDQVQGVLQAWYPGTSGGEAIANLLVGRVNPSGRLPISFPKDESQLARKTLVETDAQGKKSGEVNYTEGATVGYKWYDAHKLEPLFPFGFGLTYTQFEYSGLQARLDGERPGREIQSAQRRRTGWPGRAADLRVAGTRRLGGAQASRRLAEPALQHGKTAEVELHVDPRLLARFDVSDNSWRIAAGSYKVMVGQSAAKISLETSITVPERRMAAGAAKPR